MSNIQQEYWLKTKRTIQSTIGEDDILWYQSDYVQWLEKELMASRDSRILSDVSVEQLVNKFLKWQLPASVSSDQCVTQPGLTNRTGTNLLTYIEATQMIEHLLADVR